MIREEIARPAVRGADLAAIAVKCSNCERTDINELMKGLFGSYSSDIVYCGMEKLDPTICVVEKLIGEDKVLVVGAKTNLDGEKICLTVEVAAAEEGEKSSRRGSRGGPCG